MTTKVFLLDDTPHPLMLDIAEHGIPDGTEYVFILPSTQKDQVESIIESIVGNFKTLGRNIKTRYFFIEHTDAYHAMGRILDIFMTLYRKSGKFELHIAGSITTGIYAYTVAILAPWVVSRLFLYSREIRAESFPILHLVNPMLMRKLASTVIRIIDDIGETTEDALASETRKDRSTISRVVKAMIESGLVGVGSKRPRKIFLTPMGQLIARILKYSEKIGEKTQCE